MDITIEKDLSFTTDTIAKKNMAELNTFLTMWDKQYDAQAKRIPMFNETISKQWTTEQKKFFVKIFYHARGHFHDFLWYMGNHAPDKECKEIILHNIMEEFGGHAPSHEELYIHFAESLGVQDINDEVLNQQTYLPFLKEFNQGHLKKISSHLWEDNLSIFSAYERLDNIDYKNLMKLIKTLGVPDKDSIFFKVHMKVEHFETTLSTLLTIWGKNKQIVLDAFNFIASHQLKMWESLSKAVAGYS